MECFFLTIFFWRYGRISSIPFLKSSIPLILAVEASHAKVTQAAAFKHNPLLPFSHTFGLNMTFCY